MSINTGMAKEDMIHIHNGILLSHELPTWRNDKESAYQHRSSKRWGFNPWVGKIPWRRKWQTTPVFLPGNFNGQRSLVGCTSRGHKDLDTTKHPCITQLLKKEWNKAICNNTDEPIMLSEVRQRPTSYITYMWNLKIWHQWTYLQNNNRLRDLENKLLVTRGERHGGGIS